MQKSKWEKIGEISVDAGLCMIGDPCYLRHKTHPIHDWDKFCDMLSEHDNKHGYPTAMQLEHAPDAPGLGVVVSTGWGDGSYDVFVKKVDGRIAEVKVKFI